LLKDAGASPWCDFVLGPADFGPGRTDLGDFRLVDGAGREIPYALRIRRADSRGEPLPTHEFNRAVGSDGTSRLALDLGTGEAEHNEVELEMAGTNVRRHVRVDGSVDGIDWHELASKDWLRFRVGGKDVEDRRIPYPPSRFRFVRVRVGRDPEVDKDVAAIDRVVVRRRIEVPGESLTLPAALGVREPVRTPDGPASAWVLDLGGENVPCERLSVDVADTEFARDYRVEAGGREGSGEPLREIARGLWRRRAGEAKTPLVAEFSEALAARLRLVVLDQSNPPLMVRSAVFSAPAREVVFGRPVAASQTYRFYLGNPKANPPGYDFARNLPERLDPTPTRLALSPRRENPVYRPEPKPLTERWPWLIYVVLGAVCVVLGAIILELGRTAIKLHDSRQPVGS
jgi:hypothetical protein